MNFNIGDLVEVKNTNFTGYIKKINNNGTCYIDINNKLIKTNISNIEKKEAKPRSNNVTINYNYEHLNSFIPELMIRHQTLEEAMFNLDTFINEAILNDVKEVKIIHGRNGGILRKGVHDYLKSHKRVLSYRLGSYYEGSYGVTIVKLK